MAEMDRRMQAGSGWDQRDAAARKAAAEELRRERLKLERREEEIIEAAAEAGVTVRRRRDADPRAILGLKE